MRWSTEVEQKENVIDKEFLSNNRHRVADIDKFLPLSNINNPKQIELLRLRRQIIGHCIDAGLTDLADETVLDNLADCQTSRGIDGFYQKALITQRREWTEHGGNQSQDKKGFFKRIFRMKKEEDKQQYGTEEE